MKRMPAKGPSKIWKLFALPALGALIGAVPLAAQQMPGTNIIYEREVFRYPGGVRPDPFRSLLDAELGIRIEDLTLRGIVYHPDPSQSVAVLAQRGSDRRIQARIGQRVGTLRVLAIHPDRVELVVEELGVSRRETLRMTRPQPGGGS